MKNITDRAKRYRAQHNRPPGRKLCNFCGRRKNVDIDHINGREDDGEPENLMFLCRPCNTTKGIVQARNRIGIRTAQYNPEPRITFERFKEAARVLLGKPGDAAKATATIRSATPEQRAQFAEKIAAGNPLFAPQAAAKPGRFKGARYGLEVDVTGRGNWVEQGLYETRRKAETEGARIAKREGMRYHVKATRDERNPEYPTFAQYAHGVSIHRRGAHDEGGRIIHATPAAARHKYAQEIARRKRQRGEVPF